MEVSSIQDHSSTAFTLHVMCIIIMYVDLVCICVVYWVEVGGVS